MEGHHTSHQGDDEELLFSVSPDDKAGTKARMDEADPSGYQADLDEAPKRFSKHRSRASSNSKGKAVSNEPRREIANTGEEMMFDMSDPEMSQIEESMRNATISEERNAALQALGETVQVALGTMGTKTHFGVPTKGERLRRPSASSAAALDVLHLSRRRISLSMLTAYEPFEKQLTIDEFQDWRINHSDCKTVDDYKQRKLETRSNLSRDATASV